MNVKLAYFFFSALSFVNFASAKFVGDDVMAESVWQKCAKFHSDKTGMFYGLPPDKIPSPDDIKKLLPKKKNGVPNWHGGFSGIEDCSLFNGTLLSAFVDEYSVTKDNKIATRARGIYRALRLNATAHGDAGFVARGVSPIDGKTVYPGTSVDQYTHFMYGMLKYYQSPIADKAERADIAEIFSQIADKMTREIRADTKPTYSFKFYKGMDDDRGTGRMIYENPMRSSMRLAMVYAAAYLTTLNEQYYSLYGKHFPSAFQAEMNIAQNHAKIFKKWYPTYVAIQKMFALDIVLRAEKNAEQKEKIKKLMDMTAKSYAENPLFKFKENAPDGRSVRDCSELLHARFLAPSYKLNKLDKNVLMKSLARVGNYAGSSYTILGAYWCARTFGEVRAAPAFNGKTTFGD